jgi:hypothetical protein
MKRFCKVNFVLKDCSNIEKQDRTKYKRLKKAAKGMSRSSVYKRWDL